MYIIGENIHIISPKVKGESLFRHPLPPERPSPAGVGPATSCLPPALSGREWRHFGRVRTGPEWFFIQCGG